MSGKPWTPFFSYEPTFPEKISWMDVYRLTNSPPKINVGYLLQGITCEAGDGGAREPRRPSRGFRKHVRRVKAEKRRKEG